MKYLLLFVSSITLAPSAFAGEFYNCASISGPQVSATIQVTNRGYTNLQDIQYLLASGAIDGDRLILKFYPSDANVGLAGTVYASCDID